MKTIPVAVALSLFALAAVANAAKPVKPPASDDCLTCHADKEAKRSNGRSVFVGKQKFDASVHGQAGVGCVDCHTDLAAAEDFPHNARLKKVDCATCHDAAPASHPFHPELAGASAGKTRSQVQVACADCHGTHEITPVKDAAFARNLIRPDLPGLPQETGHRGRRHRPGDAEESTGADLPLLSRQQQGGP
jgi:hypothetical protein